MSEFVRGAIDAALEASARLAALPKRPKMNDASDAAQRRGAMEVSLTLQERAAWLVAAKARASVNDEAALRMLERDGWARGYLNAVVFPTLALRAAAESGNFDSLRERHAQHFTRDGQVRQETQ